MKPISVFFLAFVLFSVVGFNFLAREPSTAQVLQKTRNDIVVIVNKMEKDGKTGQGLGTGFFIDDNTIITNNHVIDSTTKLTIYAYDNPKEYEATVKWKDATADIAVLELKDWKTFKKDNPRTGNLRLDFSYSQGDKVIVVGHPSELFFSASQGIVSQKRERIVEGDPKFFIGTDAHLYPGNSGGPMMDFEGDVLAVSDIMIQTQGGSYGFGIPAIILQKILDDFKKYNEVRWSTLGIVIKDNKIMDVAPDGAAAKAGLKKDDVINFIIVDDDRIRIKTAEDLINKLATLDYKTPIIMNINDDKEIKVEPGYKTSKDFAEAK